MEGARPHLISPLPQLSAFPELNVRTYVTAQGKLGVWFFSLDAANPLAIVGARLLFHLPYYNAKMAAENCDDSVRYTSRRMHPDAFPATFIGCYYPTDPVYHSVIGTLDYWLTERYCLYAANRKGQVWRGEIHHACWPLQPAEAGMDCNTMADQLRLILPNHKPLVHFARRRDVVGWLLERVT